MKTATQIDSDRSPMELRKKFRGYIPGVLAVPRGEQALREFMSFPFWGVDGKPYVYARLIEDPGSNRAYVCREEIICCQWSKQRQTGYRAGFVAGFRCGILAEARKALVAGG